MAQAAKRMWDAAGEPTSAQGTSDQPGMPRQCGQPTVKPTRELRNPARGPTPTKIGGPGCRATPVHRKTTGLLQSTPHGLQEKPPLRLACVSPICFSWCSK